MGFYDDTKLDSCSDIESFNVQERLRKIMAESGISAYKLSKCCNTPRSTVSRWLNSNNSLTLHTIEIICNGLGMTLYEFFYDPTSYPLDDSTPEKVKLLWNQLDMEKKNNIISYLEFLAGK